MRLSAIKAVLEGAPLGSGRLEIDTGDPTYTFKNLKNFKELLDSLHPIPQFQAIIETLRQSALYRTSQDYQLVGKEAGREIAKLANSLYAGSVSLLEMLRVALPEERPESVTIRLPDNDSP